ncbi:hypothetical protein BC834DRAFT_239315 [Gloeopeniophorella convolvens]|nr:hypothetical protein BC834DRAFT_239315 [Gloeopeniophorella convolvens]
MLSRVSTTFQAFISARVCGGAPASAERSPRGAKLDATPARSRTQQRPSRPSVRTDSCSAVAPCSLAWEQPGRVTRCGAPRVNSPTRSCAGMSGSRWGRLRARAPLVPASGAGQPIGGGHRELYSVWRAGIQRGSARDGWRSTVEGRGGGARAMQGGKEADRQASRHWIEEAVRAGRVPRCGGSRWQARRLEIGCGRGDPCMHAGRKHAH